MKDQKNATSGLRLRREPLRRDCTGVRKILASNGNFYPYEIDVAIELVQDRLERGEESDYTFVFLDVKGSLVGYTCYGPICMTDNRFDLYWIAVHEDWRGKGLGGVLLAETEESIRQMNGTYLYIETSGKDDYVRTRAFYAKSGYLEVARIPHFYKDNDDKLIYMKRL